MRGCENGIPLSSFYVVREVFSTVVVSRRRMGARLLAPFGFESFNSFRLTIVSSNKKNSTIGEFGSEMRRGALVAMSLASLHRFPAHRELDPSARMRTIIMLKRRV